MRITASIVISIVSITTTFGQATINKSDYARAVSYLYQNLNQKKFTNLNVDVSWYSDNTGFSFITQTPDVKTYNKYEYKSKKIEPLFDHERLAKALNEKTKQTSKATQLPLNFVRRLNAKEIQFNAYGKTYVLNLDSYSLTQKPDQPSRNSLEEISPDSQWIAYTKDYNLYIKSTRDGTVKQLSKTGVKNLEYATFYGWGDIMEGEGVNRPERFGVNWSPDSKWIQTYLCDLRSGNKMYLLDWSVDTLYRAKLLSYFRASPGDTNMVYMTPVFFNVESGEEIKRDQLRSTHTNPISYEWSRQPGIIYEENFFRGYQKITLSRYNLTTKTEENLYTETSNTNLDGYNSWIMENLGKVIIASEKDGWRQLYGIDLKDKSLKRITQGDYYVNNINYTDSAKKFIVYSASGKEPGRNPYLYHTYKINIDGSGFSLLTPEDANHDVSISPDGKYFIDNMSSLDKPTVTTLRETANGKIVSEISRANVDGLMAMGYKHPESFTAIGRDGVTTIYGAMWKPSNFDPSKKYPVIDQTYTGPHTNMYPRNFQTGLARSNQALAELGFIVVTIDGLGSAGRSKAFHNFSYKNMGKNLTCHMLAIKELAKKYSWVDADRVGIFGHSAGGYDAGHAVLEFPDFYKVAVASSSDHDFRMEKDWWPEMYMGWPVDSTYNQVSNITMAGNLKGKLLITHGGIDENVNPSATFKLAEALVKADKEFDMLIFPSQHHGYVGKFNDYFLKKRWNYFVENLLGAKPIWGFELK